MSKIALLMTCWATLAGMTAYADPCGCASPEEGTDPFAVALEAMENGISVPDHADADTLAPLDCLDPGEHSSVASATLAHGKVSSFHIGEHGVERVTVSGDGGLWVGDTAVDNHVIEITGTGELVAGTYTLIDYEGSIGGAGFKGLILHSAPHLHAELVHNAADTRIELVVRDASKLTWSQAVIGYGKLALSKLRAPLERAGAANS